MKGTNPHDEIKGSSPSPGAWFNNIAYIAYPKALSSTVRITSPACR
ncbi:MAG: hypothetical protein M3288_10450 [Thermoproteota archaeon]|nr:hypothetical protein [Thermoproteota archaeon]